jgi:hypothetical protein
VTNRFVFLPHGMDQLLQYEGDAHEAPKGALAVRVRAIPELDQRWRDAIQTVLVNAWDVPALEAKIDQIAVVVHSTERTDERVTGDLQRFDENIGYMKGALAQRKQVYLEER